MKDEKQAGEYLESLLRAYRQNSTREKIKIIMGLRLERSHF